MLHVVNYVPERRTEDLDVIEEPQPIIDAEGSVLTGVAPRKVYSAPEGASVRFEFAEGYTTIALPRIVGHSMIVPGGLEDP